MIRRMVLRLVRPPGRLLRRIAHRLIGFHELRVRLDKQDLTLQRLEETLRDPSRQQELLSEIARVQAELDSTLAEEINRLDGYLLFHAAELRSAIDTAVSRDGSILPLIPGPADADERRKAG